MGGVVGQLICLFCRSGCQPSVVASALAFHPPVPFYSLTRDEGAGKYNLQLVADLPAQNYANLEAQIIITSSKTKVPLFVLRHPEARYTIIYSHGNAADIGLMLFIFELLVKRLKVNLVGYDYTGYGASKDFGVVPTEKQVFKDITAVFEWVVEQGIATPEQIILYGQSVGSGPSCYLAGRKPVAGLILHSPILSGLRVITSSRSLACFDIFPNLKHITQVKAPVFIIHGLQDREVPVVHGQRLLELTKEKYRALPWWVEQRGHNDVLHGNEKEYLKRMREFIAYIDVFKSKDDSEVGRMVSVV